MSKKPISSHLFLPLLVLLQLHAFSQQYGGTIVDKESHEKIPFVNIGVLNKSLGTVTNDAGAFLFDIDSKFDQDSLRIFMIGYKPKTYLVADFKNQFAGNSGLIELDRAIVNLEAVIVYSKKTRTEIAGKTFHNKNMILGLATDKKGCEIAAQIKIKKRRTTLQELHINIANNPFDSVLLRINLYNSFKGKPGQNILNKPIYVVAKQKTGKLSVDLVPYKIVVDSSFFTAVQWISEKNDKVLQFCSGMGGAAFIRSSSEDTWFNNKPFGLGINCKVTYEIN